MYHLQFQSQYLDIFLKRLLSLIGDSSCYDFSVCVCVTRSVYIMLILPLGIKIAQGAICMK